MGLNASTLATIRAILDKADGGNDQEVLTAITRASAIWRSKLLANSLLSLYGNKVMTGPFAGMEYLTRATEGALLPRLLGSYESELHPHLAALAAEGLDRIIDVGCAEGYYAVGLARLMPQVIVHAHDTDPAARAACAELAALNGVSDRIHIGAEFSGDDFAGFEGSRTLVFMDIEGGERALLDPERWPALKTLKIVVETHPGPTFAMTKEIAGRFVATHEVIWVNHAGKTTPMPPWLGTLSHYDRVIAWWEWRLHPTPWLVMRPRAAAAPPS